MSTASVARANSSIAQERGESLRGSFARVSIGYAVYSACQWGIMSVLAKLGSPELVGQYALAMAITTPVLMLAQMNLRTVLATDVREAHDFRHYRNLRFLLLSVAMLVIGVLAWQNRGETGRSLAIVFTGLVQAGEWVADIYYGRMQQQGCTGRMALSLIARGVLGITALGIALWISKNLPLALLWMLAARTLVYFFYDSSYGLRGLPDSGPRVPWKEQAASLGPIFEEALPLGIVLTLSALVLNTPRYFIASSLGEAQLGIFSAIFSLATAGSLLMNSLGQSATPKLARAYVSGDASGFRRLSIKMAILAAGLGLLGMAAAALLGTWVITFVYRPEYARQPNLLIAAMAAAGVGFVASLLGYAITAARRFREQMPLQLACLAATALCAWLLVPRMGLTGGALSVGAGFAIQVLAEAWILRQVLKSMIGGPQR